MIACPGCAAPVARRALQRKPAGTVELDLCHPCHFIWFDRYESGVRALVSPPRPPRPGPGSARRRRTVSSSGSATPSTT